MAGPSSRPTPRPAVAQAAASPTGIVVGVVVAVVAVVAGLPVAVGVALGVVAWAVKLVLAVLGIGGPSGAGRGRRRRGLSVEDIDPFGVQEPWRLFVKQAVQTRNRFDEVVEAMAPGPLHDNLAGVAERVRAGAEESWRIAQRGQALDQARRSIDVADLARRRRALGLPTPGAEPGAPATGSGAPAAGTSGPAGAGETGASGGPAGAGAGEADSTATTAGASPERSDAERRADVEAARVAAAAGNDPLEAVNADAATAALVRSLDAQQASADRLERVIAEAQTRLRLLDARLREALTRATELATTGSTASVGALGADVDDVVTELEALRQALEETHGSPGAGGIAATGGQP